MWNAPFDNNYEMSGETEAHGCPFRDAHRRKGCLQNGARCFEIGLRATGYSKDDFDFGGAATGWNRAFSRRIWHRKSLDAIEGSDIRCKIGDAPGLI